MKINLFLLACILLLPFSVSAQTVQFVSGSYCVGSGTTYNLNGTSCSSYSWAVSSGTKGVDYNYSSNTGPSFSVSWLKPMSNIYVRCTYNCSGSGSTAYSANFTINANAPQYSVTGGGSYCANGGGVTITLNGSSTGVTYQLNVNGSPSGASVSGTGSPLSWPNKTVAGNYTVTASTCPTTMSGSATVVVNPLPTAYTVLGGGMYCAGGTGVNVKLSGSQTGVNYQLILNGSNTGTPVAGTGSEINWPNLTATGTYTASAVNASTSCANQMNGSVSVSLTNVTPAIFGIQKISAANCGPVDVQLTGSQNNINYQLKLNGVNVPISAVAGGAIPLAPVSWKNLVNSGTYTIEAQDPSTQCKQMMGGQVLMNPNPVQFSVQGGGSYCTGGTGRNINLSGSEIGVNYQLILNGSNVGNPVAGTGSLLSWPNLTSVGTYTASAVNATTSCSNAMNGSASISITTITPAIFGIQKTSSNFCGPIDVQLSGSQNGVNYQLKRNGINVPVSAVAGGPIPLAPNSWKGLVNSGTYTIEATDPTTQCVQLMGGEVVMNPNPVQLTISGGGAYCLNTNGVTVSLFNTQVGVNYQLIVNGTNTGLPIAGNGSSISWPNQTVAGTYTASAVYAGTGCSNPMNGSVAVSIINNLPAMFGVSGGGCCGAINVQLSGSQTGVNYQLKRNGVNVAISPVAGGPIPLAPVSWKNLTAEGIYTVEATGQCTQLMGGSAIMNSAIPVANAGPDITMDLPVPSLTLVGSGADYGGITAYQWSKLSGPDVLMSNATTSNLLLTNLIAGTYEFKLVVADNFGEISLPDVVVVHIVNNYNWVTETTVRVSDKQTESAVNSISILDGNKSVNWNYFDGLGRAQQAVMVQSSFLGNDVVTPLAYDEFGREPKKFLPYVSSENDGSLKIDALIDPTTTETDPVLKYRSGRQYAFYQNGTRTANDQYPFSEASFEASPLNKVLKQGNPGVAFQVNSDPYSLNDKTVKNVFSANGENEIIAFRLNGNTHEIEVSSNAAEKYYPANHLFVNKRYDERNNLVVEFIDKEGRVVCKKIQYDGNELTPMFAFTYYVYDNFGNLLMVLPPEAVKNLKTAFNLN